MDESLLCFFCIVLSLLIKEEGGGMQYYSYILKSLKTCKYYYGSPQSIEGRVKVHNSGKVRSTKHRRPWELHFYEEWDTRIEAVRRERFYKSVDGYKYLKQNGII